MRQLTLTENEFPRAVDLTVDEAELLSVLELAIVTRSPGSTGWDVAAGKKVGVARIGDLQVTVRPKIMMDRLVFLMGYARRPDFWRDQTVLLDADIDLVEALAESFRRLATKALEQGLLQGYRSVDEALPLVRGRIRVGEQISRRFGRGLPIEVTYDDFTVDIAENRLLLAATLRLLHMPMLPRRVRKSLLRVRLQLADVTPPVAATFCRRGCRHGSM
jgi:5-methylcytosine-specific restriction enzyme subunit McrC